MWSKIGFFFAGVVIGVLLIFAYTKSNISHFLNPLGKKINLVVQKPLDVYTFANLRKFHFVPSSITIGKKVDETNSYTSYVFYYNVHEPGNLASANLQKVSGLMNVPKTPGTYPVIVMYRGYVDPKQYAPGIGTNPVAHVLASHGYITLAPDFLGYGSSSAGAINPWENRFQTYTTAVTLLDSLSNMNTGLANDSQTSSYQIDPHKVGIWAHSNGGHIALATLAITGATYPTVLWAPVSKPFPYSIIYYTDEENDLGKSLISLLSTFEEDYNTTDFDPAANYKYIKAPIQLNQGMNDEEVPYWWSEELDKTLKKDGDHVTLYEYQNSDHNLLPDGWNTAVTRALSFYTEKL